MEQFIGCDAHKKFSVFVAVNEKGQAGEALRVAHDRQLYREFLARLPAHSAIAVEASGSYSWLVDEMERSGHYPRLCNPLEAKRCMGLTNKTDKLDARGLAILLRNGTLPEVWIPPSELRDQRELLRLRIFLVKLRTRVKNRIHGTLSRLIAPAKRYTPLQGQPGAGEYIPMKRSCLLLIVSAFAFAAADPYAAALFQKHCATCHQAGGEVAARIPQIAVLKTRSQNSILRTLETGAMKQQASVLSAGERQLVANWLGTPVTTELRREQILNSCPAGAAWKNTPGWSGW